MVTFQTKILTYPLYVCPSISAAAVSLTLVLAPLIWPPTGGVTFTVAEVSAGAAITASLLLLQVTEGFSPARVSGKWNVSVISVPCQIFALLAVTIPLLALALICPAVLVYTYVSPSSTIAGVAYTLDVLPDC